MIVSIDACAKMVSVRVGLPWESVYVVTYFVTEASSSAFIPLTKVVMKATPSRVVEVVIVVVIGGGGDGPSGILVIVRKGSGNPVSVVLDIDGGGCDVRVGMLPEVVLDGDGVTA